MIVSVQLLNFFTRKKYRIADEHFLYFISQLRFLIGMLNLCSIFLSVITLKWNREENGGGSGGGAGLQID